MVRVLLKANLLVGSQISRSIRANLRMYQIWISHKIWIEWTVFHRVVVGRRVVVLLVTPVFETELDDHVGDFDPEVSPHATGGQRCRVRPMILIQTACIFHSMAKILVSFISSERMIEPLQQQIVCCLAKNFLSR